MQSIQQLASRVRLFIMDVDGVLTDGRIFITPTGEELKSFNTLDGHGLKMLQQSGVALAIITGRAAACVELRAKSLGIQHLYMGSESKMEAFQHLLAATGLTPEDCAYMGDDVIDLPVMRRVGFAVSVPDAPNVVRSHAHYVSGCRGGEGAVREVTELIMQSQGTLDAALARYLV